VAARAGRCAPHRAQGNSHSSDTAPKTTRRSPPEFGHQHPAKKGARYGAEQVGERNDPVSRPQTLAGTEDARILDVHGNRHSLPDPTAVSG